MKQLTSNISKLYAFSFLQMMLFPMAIITLFWKDHIGLSLTQILLLQSILSMQSFCFRLMFAISGPLVDMLADASGVRQTFRYLLVVFLVVLPPLAFVYVRNLREEGT